MILQLKNAVILDKNSPLNGKKTDLYVNNGIISFAKNLKASQTIDLKGAYVCPGFFDMRAFVGEPGLEYIEDFNSIEDAASAGGFTDVALLPNTKPVADNKEIIGSLLNKNKPENLVDFYPYASISKGANGEELAEIIDLHNNGAIAFTDGHNPLKHIDLLMKSLQYTKPLNALIIDVPVNANLSKKGIVNESEISTVLGLPGIPQIAVEIAVENALKILEYTGGKLHLSLITNSKSVELIKNAKKKGLHITCDTAALYLHFSEECYLELDSNYKVFPPLKSTKDMKALKKGLEDGTIDVLVSDHRPVNIEGKKIEFDKANYGMSSIETTFSWAFTAGLSPEKIVETLSCKPREILNVKMPVIKEGEKAKLTIFNKENFDFKSSKSKSKNNPSIGKILKGKIIGTVNGKRHRFNS